MATKKITTEALHSFWDHLEVLRWMFIRILVVLTFIFGFVFSQYEFVFSKILLSPTNSNFITYRLLKQILQTFGLSPSLVADFKIQLVNYELSGQFMMQISGSVLVASVLALPYIIYELWRFIRPALLPNESKHIGLIFFFSSFLFYTGAMVSYFIIFPLTIHFLGTYQVSEMIPNQISIQSYFNALLILVLSMGLTFEMPILSYFLSKIGIVSKSMLSSGRRYAFVIILTLAAIITPTTDPFTLMAVTIPLYLLYEVSIWVCRNKQIDEEDDEEENLETDS